MRRKRCRTYTPEFRKECAQYVHNNPDMTYAEAAENLGVPQTTLQKWCSKHNVRSSTNTVEEPPTISSDRELIRRLQEENRRLKMEAEILKKAAAFFAKDQW